jgi:hypothetical protein
MSTREVTAAVRYELRLFTVKSMAFTVQIIVLKKDN